MKSLPWLLFWLDQALDGSELKEFLKGHIGWLKRNQLGPKLGLVFLKFAEISECFKHSGYP